MLAGSGVLLKVRSHAPSLIAYLQQTQAQDDAAGNGAARSQLAALHSQLLEALTALQQRARGVARQHLHLAPIANQARTAHAALENATGVLERISKRLRDQAAPGAAGGGARGKADPARMGSELEAAAEALHERLADVQRAEGQLTSSQGELSALQVGGRALVPCHVGQ